MLPSFWLFRFFSSILGFTEILHKDIGNRFGGWPVSFHYWTFQTQEVVPDTHRSRSIREDLGQTDNLGTVLFAI
jgi:hypothetical protein